MAKKILITHQKGGVGKSTLVCNIAQNLSDTCKVAVLDMDLQGSMAQLSGIIEDFTVTTDKSILDKPNSFDFIIIDTPPYLSNELTYLIQISDFILIPSKPGILDLMAITATINIITNENKLSATMVILNMVKPNTTLTYDIQKRIASYGVRIANTQISDLVCYTRSVLLKGVQGNKKAQKQIDSITKEILVALI